MEHIRSTILVSLLVVLFASSVATGDVVWKTTGAIINGEVQTDDPDKSYIMVETKMGDHWVELSIPRTQIQSIVLEEGDQGKPSAADSGEGDAKQGDADAPLPTLPELLKQWPDDGFFKVKLIGRPTSTGPDPDNPRVVFFQQTVRVTKNFSRWNRFVGLIRQRLTENLGVSNIKNLKWQYSKVRLTREWQPGLPSWLRLSITRATNAAQWGKYSRINETTFYTGLSKASDAGAGDVFVFVDKSLNSGWDVHASPDLYEQLQRAFASVPSVHVQLTDRKGNSIGQVGSAVQTQPLESDEGNFGPGGSFGIQLTPSGFIAGMSKAPRLTTVSPYISILATPSGGFGSERYLGESVDLIFQFDVPFAEKDLALKVDVELR
ncbi:MAG: hypothetical protein P8I91_10000 [Phycisphaerales bacterium]|nr:hypothetical protein [Phycisphaerales bacterium]